MCCMGWAICLFNDHLVGHLEWMLDAKQDIYQFSKKNMMLFKNCPLPPSLYCYFCINSSICKLFINLIEALRAFSVIFSRQCFFLSRFSILLDFFPTHVTKCLLVCQVNQIFLHFWTESKFSRFSGQIKIDAEF